MKLLCLLLIALATFSLKATSIDDRLQSYIKKFQLTTVKAPEIRNEKLFVLGGRLFFDRDLSGNKNISCADCHHPRLFSTDHLPLALGEGASGLEIRPGGRQQHSGKIIPRNSPALFNLHHVESLFWDGRVTWNQKSEEVSAPVRFEKWELNILKNALAMQALFPLLSHEEMKGQIGTNEIANAFDDREAWDLILKRIFEKDQYTHSFEDLFPGEKLSIAHVGRALAHFQSHAFYSSDSNYDRYLRGEKEAMSELEKKGMEVFFTKGECWKCHKGELLSDFSFHNIGVPQIGPGKRDGDDLGLFYLTGKNEHKYAFRVPPLRNVALTAPYFHDGSFRSLEEVVEHYDDVKASLENYELPLEYPNYVEVINSQNPQTIRDQLDYLSFKLNAKLHFTEDEEEALVEFLKTSLTDNRFKDR
jgi:cytochrome c peroxidase